MNTEPDPIEETIVSPTSGFFQFNLDPMIIQGLEKLGFKEPTAIQAQAIPLILEGKDLIALAHTGSGKTAACAIPICHRVDVSRPEVQALIIVPTRELALQYATDAQKIGKYKGVKTFAILGGEDAGLQQSKLKHGVQVLVATPGRLIDFIYSRQIDLTHVETLILDEADEMLSMGFYDDLEFIIQCLIHEHQTLLFSATMPLPIQKLAKSHMKEPHEVNLVLEVRNPEKIKHCFLYCRSHHKEEELIKQITQNNPVQAIVFCQSRHQVESVCQVLQKKFPAVDFLHAGMSQDIRTIVTNKFRSGKIRILVATDVVARGLDFSKVSHVFIYQLPKDLDTFVHRSGRTGRYDKEGVVITLVTSHDLELLKRTLRHLNKEPIWLGDPPPEEQQKSKLAETKRPRRPHSRNKNQAK